MHAVGLHSALAIRRERRRRAEAARARERRCSLQSSESGLTSPHCSQGSLERRRARAPPPADNEVVSSVGMLHLGVVFLVLGLFLLGSGALPDDVTSWSNVGSASWFNELVCSGLFALAIGAFLIALHRHLTKSEEDALEEYVQRQLTRSRSGHRLERDAETGGMRTRHARRARATEVGLPPPDAALALIAEEPRAAPPPPDPADPEPHSPDRAPYSPGREPYSPGREPYSPGRVPYSGGREPYSPLSPRFARSPFSPEPGERPPRALPPPARM